MTIRIERLLGSLMIVVPLDFLIAALWYVQFSGARGELQWFIIGGLAFIVSGLGAILNSVDWHSE